MRRAAVSEPNRINESARASKRLAPYNLHAKSLAMLETCVLQYLTRSALSRVESRHIRVFRLFTFPAFLSKTRQYTQDFIVPSNFHHNLDTVNSTPIVVDTRETAVYNHTIIPYHIDSV